MIDDKILVALESHFKQWQQIAERVRGQITPALKVQETFLLTEQNRLRELAGSIKVPHFDLSDLFPLTKQVAEFQESLQGLIMPAFEQLQRSFRELPPRTQEALLLLGAHGWYLT